MSRTKRARFVLCASIALVSLAVAAGGANAAPPLVGSGTFTYQSSTFDGIRQAGGNTIIELSATVLYTGTFAGTSTLSGTLTLHPDGTANFHDVETFTGTVNGVPGTVTFNLAGTGPAGLFKGTDVIVSGTGGLANLRGVLSEVGTVPAALPGPLGTYTGHIH